MLSAASRRLFSDPESTASVVRRVLADNAGVYRVRYAIAFIFMALTAGSTAFTAWLIGDAVDDIFVREQLAMVWFFGGLIVALSVVRGISTYMQTLMLARISNNIIARLQRRIFDKLLRLDIGYFAHTHSSQLVTRINNAARATGDMMNSLVTSVGNDLLTLFALLGVMLLQDAAMTVLTLLIAPPVVIGVVRLVRKIREMSGEEFSGLGEVIATAQETASGIRIVKSFTLEDSVRERAEAACRGVEERRNEIARLRTLTSPLMETLGGAAIGLALMYAGWQTVVGGQTPGAFMSFIVAFLLAYEPAKRLARLRVTIERNAVLVRRVYELLDLPEETPDAPDAREVKRAEGTLELRDVRFAYPDDAAVLHGVSLYADKGETVALVGPSGGGKSTIVSLLQRFYEPQEGEILLDGRDIRTITRESLRRNLAYVSQDAFLFGGTVRLNLAAGRPEATEAEIIAAAKAANAWDFISALPQGLDTEIGENGVMLSGGQRQRLTIARAILKDAPVLLLDEATSALDAESERQVQAGLDALMAGRTTLVIAHRLSTILRADRIYVLKEGRVVEEGDHAALLAAGGLYARLYQTDAFGVGPAFTQDAAG